MAPCGGYGYETSCQEASSRCRFVNTGYSHGVAFHQDLTESLAERMVGEAGTSILVVFHRLLRTYQQLIFGSLEIAHAARLL